MSSAETIRTALVIAAIVLGALILLGALVWATDVFLLAALGILFAVLLVKLSELCQRATRLPYHANLAIVVVSLLTVSGGGGYLLGDRIFHQLERADGEIEETVENLGDRLRDNPTLWSYVRAVPFGSDLFPETDAEDEPGGDAGPSPDDRRTDRADSATTAEKLRRFAGPVARVAQKIFKTTFSFVTNTALVLFVGFFIAVQPTIYQGGLIALFPPPRRSEITELLRETGDMLWRWLLGRFATMLITGVGVGVTLALLGVPLAATLGVATGLLAFIPNIGAVIALGLAVIMAIPVGLTTTMWVVISYLGFQLLESNVSEPLIQQRQVAVPPALLITFQVLMGTLTGFLGILVATPILAVAIMLIRRLYIEEDLEAGAATE